MRIAHFGTFDVENYGDLLFPLLLERRLGGQEVEFVHVSPVGGAPDLKDCKPAIGFEEALAGCESWDAIVFGGGELGHGESAGDLEKYRDPAIQTIAYPGLWLLPAFIAHLRGIPLVWNAPGIPGNFSEERKRQLMQWACWQADYLSVRDVQSATVLAESLVEAKVVPDTAVEVSSLWSDRELRAEIARLKRREEWPQNRYLALHLKQRYADGDLVARAEEIKQICGSRGAVALLIAIGGCHGDEGVARRILEHLQGHEATIFVPDSLRSVAAAIRFSDGYVGSSLHGAITAYSLARPFLLVAPEWDSRIAGFLAHVGAQDRQAATWAAAVEVVGHWPPSKQQTEIAGGRNKSVMEALDQHWATLSERLTTRRPVSSLAGAQLLETLSQMPPEWFPFIPMLERSPLFAQVIEKYREPWNSVRRQLQSSAFVAAAAYRRLELRHQKLISDVSNLQAKLSEQRKTVEKLGGQIQEQRQRASALQKAIERRDQQIQQAQRQTKEQREQANALQKTIGRRDRQIASVQNQLNDSEDRWRKDLAKLGKWSDRLLQDYQRVLKSNRWRMGCWLNLKRADEKSKEAQRLAQLIASRPRPASVGRDVPPIRASTGKGKPDAPTRPAPESGKQDASLRRGSGAQARPTISAGKKLSPPLDPRGKPGAVSKEAERGGQLISIVIPVYDAHDDLIRCLESVERHSRPEHPVIVIDDASPDERIWPLLEHWATQHQNLRAVRNESNLGYTATVNRGCELAGPGDIILLNSDTIVPAHWIEQMAACAYSRPGVATVTAISNAAGAFSVPRKNAINNLPPRWSVDQMAAFVERNSQRVRPVVPTGNGFCMYLTSAARAAVGPFDAEHFPNGYGEENDYCLRASAAGLVNLIDDATYVFHRRSASFGPAKEEISKKSRATLDELHPEYSQLIREWNQMDALDPVRGEMQRRIDAALATGIDKALPGDARLCLLFVLHEGGGGTRFTSEDLSRAVARRYRVVVLRTAVDSWSVYRYFDDARLVSVRRYAFAEPWRVERPMTPARWPVVREICADYQVVLAHVHHLLGSGPELLTLLRQMDIPIVFSFHDFYTVCPTINLLDETHTYCAGRCTAGAGDCPLPKSWFREPRPWLKHRYVYQHRRRMATVLELCDAWVTSSEATRKVITQYFPALDDGRFSIIEHGRDLVRLELAKAPDPGKPLRAVFFGAFNFNLAKGLDFILNLLRRNRDAGNPIEFHVLGQKSRAFQPEMLGAVYHGPYQRDELAEHIRAIAPAVSLIPSLSPETYCHVLTESWAMGLPVLVSDIGTLRERVLKHGGGWLLPVGDAERWLAKLRALSDDLQGYASALQEIRAMTFPDITFMADQYDAIYARLLANRPRRRRSYPASEPSKDKISEALSARIVASAKNALPLPPRPAPGNVSICFIVLHHSGEHHLRNLFSSFLSVNTLNSVEFRLVLHACTDGSREVVRSFQDRLPIKITDCDDNQSFAYANNRAAEATSAEYLVFLNNDIVFQENAVPELLRCLQDRRNGVAGLRLVFPPDLLPHAVGLREKPSAAPKGVERGGPLSQAEVERYQERRARYQRQIESLQKQFKEAETHWEKDLAKIGKWSDRVVDDLARLLKSNRWRLGCWLSLKRSGRRSKEAHRLARLVATRPQPSVSQEKPVTTPDGATNRVQKPRQFVDRNALERDAVRPAAALTKIAEPPRESQQKPADAMTNASALQHGGIKFRPDPQFFSYRPFNLGLDLGLQAFIPDTPRVLEKFPAVTAALAMCRRSDFLAVGGFCEKFSYGYEDVDLCLSFRRLLGLRSVSANHVACIHDESATRRLNTSEDLRRRRLNNTNHLVRRHGWYLRREILADKMAGGLFFSDEPLTAAFAVTASTPDTAAGDFFTASELARACCNEFGWKIRYLSRQNDWYDLEGVDVLVVLIDSYEPSKIRRAKPDLVKVAWMRNWFERWVSRPDFDHYDLYLCSSIKSAQWLREAHRKPAWVFPLATNPHSFAQRRPDPGLSSDYCFTGNYWQAEREIETAVQPEKLEGYKFAVFGKNWEAHPTLGAYARGFRPYSEMPVVYSSTRVVVDDANSVTKEWGSVNSRVFDALVAGALVITNGVTGAAELFDQQLPTSRSADELQSLLRRYLSNEEERQQLVAQLRERVLSRHTYRRRARSLKRILIDRARRGYRIAFKIGAPSRGEAPHWGDYHFARSLGRCFAAKGHSFRIDCLDEWERPECFGDDIVIVLRGLSRYRPKPSQINLMWNISHPDKIDEQEYEEFDHVFVASEVYAAELASRLSISVSTLLQCTDPEIFFPDPNPNIPAEELLFVGNSRKQYREVVRFAVEAGLPLGVYGTHWPMFISDEHIRGEYIENAILRQYYSRCDILLNDHWPSMREHGFVSNRLFDAAAAEAFLISDSVPGIEEVFGEDLVTYQDATDFREQVEYYLNCPEERRVRAQRLRSRVLAAHTFAHRAEVILAKIRGLDKSKRGTSELTTQPSASADPKFVVEAEI